ncbi:histone-fold-containing protein [Panaeolus papilionaceus]|nr:histone-fold-containing protein [Panaeolus papilionaceus]
MPRSKPDQPPMDAAAQQTAVTDGIDNFELPKSVVMKIAKSALPDNIKLQKETVHALVKGSTVFINYLAATAHGVAQSKQHKSISASDVIKALELIEFPLMAERIQPEAALYRQKAKSDVKPKKSSSNSGAGGSASKKSKSKGKEKAASAASSTSTATGGGISINIPPLSGVSSSASTAGGPFTSSPLDLNSGSISTPGINKMGQHGSSSLRTGVIMRHGDDDPEATEDDRMDVDEETSVSTGPNARAGKPSMEDVDAEEPVESEVEEGGDDEEVDEEDEVDEAEDDEIEDDEADDDDLIDKDAMDDEDLRKGGKDLEDD